MERGPRAMLQALFVRVKALTRFKFLFRRLQEVGARGNLTFRLSDTHRLQLLSTALVEVVEPDLKKDILPFWQILRNRSLVTKTRDSTAELLNKNISEKSKASFIDFL